MGWNGALRFHLKFAQLHLGVNFMMDIICDQFTKTRSGQS
eukprot:COSAG06_NODE_5069_length_3749_cov_9.249315_2_plen_40_part_00